jgi:hypothetical protein
MHQYSPFGERLSVVKVAVGGLAGSLRQRSLEILGDENAFDRLQTTRGCPADHVMALRGSAISLTGFQAHRGAVVGFSP